MLRLASVFLVVVPALALPVQAQDPPRAPADPSPAAEVAEEFQWGFQSMAWEGLAQRIHPDALAYVRFAAEVVIAADTTGWALANLGAGASDLDTWRARDDARVFVELMEWMQTNSPGLLSSLASRRSAVLGVVQEGEDTAHAVYRMTMLVDGAQPEVLVMTLLRTDRGWKVREAPEFRTLNTVLRGTPIPRE